MDSENQIDNSSLLDSLLDGNDQIGGDAVGTSDEVNKSSKRMQYFGAVFNLANTVREIVLCFGFLEFSFYRRFLDLSHVFFDAQALGAGILAMPYAFEQAGLAMGLLIILVIVTLCALSQEIVILGKSISFFFRSRDPSELTRYIHCRYARMSRERIKRCKTRRFV